MQVKVVIYHKAIVILAWYYELIVLLANFYHLHP